MEQENEQIRNSSKLHMMNEIRREQELYNQEEYEEIKSKFIGGDPQQGQIDDLKRLAANGVKDAAYSFAHFAMQYLEYCEQAVALLKYYKDDLYAAHLQGVLAQYQGDKETALYFYLKNSEEDLGISMEALYHLLYEYPELRNEKNAERVDKALEIYWRDYHCC